MSQRYCITGAMVVNEGVIGRRTVLIADNIIQAIPQTEPTAAYIRENGYFHIDATGQFLIPGVIDSHVHFREPGLTHKEDILNGSRAAAAGGITSYMEMPNTIPQTTTARLTDQKHRIASRDSMANFSFYLGATNENIEELRSADLSKVCGIKVFMGSSTGNMLVSDERTLRQIFQLPVLLALHCEDEGIIFNNLEQQRLRYGIHIPFEKHALIRSREACIRSTKKALEFARAYGSRIHILHVSTAEEAALFNSGPVAAKSITSEACIHHLHFTSADHQKHGGSIKVNPSIKFAADRDALTEALIDGRIDIISTDHAPHTREEKSQDYEHCPSGGPMVQHALPLMLEHVRNKKISVETLVQRMCHSPADIFRIRKRGYIRKGYYADLVLIDPELPWQAGATNTFYKCGWSALEGQIFHNSVTHTFVNGLLACVYGRFDDSVRGMALEFE